MTEKTTLAELQKRKADQGMVEHRLRWEECQDRDGCAPHLVSIRLYRYCSHCLTLYGDDGGAVDPPPLRRLPYKRYVIESTPSELGDGNYGTKIVIEKHTGASVVTKTFDFNETRRTASAAEARGFELGKAVIDGQVKGHSVDDL